MVKILVVLFCKSLYIYPIYSLLKKNQTAILSYLFSDNIVVLEYGCITYSFSFKSKFLQNVLIDIYIKHICQELT